MVPVSAFSGRPPSGLNDRGSRHDPVHSPVGIDLLAVVRLLIGDQGAVVVLPARLPEDLVAAEEGEVHARVARRLDVRALRARPVLVVADGKEDPVVADQSAAPVGIDAGRVADVVPVALQPADHRVLGVEHRVLGRRATRRDRTVVADRIGTARIDARAADVEAVAAVLVVGLPRRVRRLKQQVRAAGVITHHEDDVALTGRAVGPHEMREVHARNRVRRDGPRCRDVPVAAIDQPRARPWSRTAGWLCGSGTDGMTVVIRRAPSPP